MVPHRFFEMHRAARFFSFGAEHQGLLCWHKVAGFFFFQTEQNGFFLVAWFFVLAHSSMVFELAQSSKVFCAGTEQHRFLSWHKAARLVVPPQSTTAFCAGKEQRYFLSQYGPP